LARGAPSLWNVAFKKRLFWDGRADRLEAQAEGPLFRPDEMGETPATLQSKLNGIPEYRRLFAETLGVAAIGVVDVAAALAAFERTLVSFGSAYDRYVAGDHAALSPAELRGYNVFRSFVSRCPECHTPPLFANGESALIDLRGEGRPFVVPTLRNIGASAPYMHDGAFGTLDEVVDFYDRGGGRPTAGRTAAKIHWHIRPLDLRAEEKADLVRFLGALTDEKASPKTPEHLPSGLAATLAD
jgi:cytochrome c peroxidase